MADNLQIELYEEEEREMNWTIVRLVVADRWVLIRVHPAAVFPNSPSLLWAPAQRKRATMLYFANVFLYFFMAALFSGPG